MVNTGDGQMRLLWDHQPAGPRGLVPALGRSKQPDDTQAPLFERPANIAEIEARQRFIRDKTEQDTPLIPAKAGIAEYPRRRAPAFAGTSGRL